MQESTTAFAGLYTFIPGCARRITFGHAVVLINLVGGAILMASR